MWWSPNPNVEALLALLLCQMFVQYLRGERIEAGARKRFVIFHTVRDDRCDASGMRNLMKVTITLLV